LRVEVSILSEWYRLMKRDEMISSLELFIEKAEKLLSMNFTTEITTKKSGFTIRADKSKPVEVEWRGPDRESVEAFVLTYRFSCVIG